VQHVVTLLKTYTTYKLMTATSVTEQHTITKIVTHVLSKAKK